MTDTINTKKPIRIILTGGGTGGHLYPALSIAKTVVSESPHSDILFIGTADRLEAKKVPEAGFAFAAINIHGIAGRRKTLKSLLSQIRGILEFVSGYAIFQSKKIIKKFCPQIVVGTGGYVCGPVLYAAHKLKIPTIILEQNNIVGKANRFAASFVDMAIACSPEAGKYFEGKGVKTVYSGNPIRPEILAATKEASSIALNINPNKKTLSVFGGSLGSTPINEALGKSLLELAKCEWFLENWQVVHITGPSRGNDDTTIDLIKEAGVEYYPQLYRDDIENVIGATDFAITRAGATFLSELSAVGMPMIIIPWSGAANDHQTENAMPFLKNGAAKIISDAELNAKRLTEELCNILNDEEKIAQMALRSRELGKPNAAKEILDYIYKIIEG